ncbi:hypothetical protein R1sor_013913 [Riccia sorocarpa]|uniref:Poly A polymerase head domain-containing protein n=1 Tax=Riccia sorocarpa TaxID=122646 RepID=A0ABD3HE50_9MARC
MAFVGLSRRPLPLSVFSLRGICRISYVASLNYLSTRRNSWVQFPPSSLAPVQTTGVGGRLGRVSAIAQRRTEVSQANFEQAAERPGKMEIRVRDEVQLTELEERIFNVLTAVVKKFGLKTQLRVAGGWVRDKLIGRDSQDIDIAIDDMLGREFCEKVNVHLASLGEETHNVGVIMSNPDQSKHLETANMRVMGMSIDFVNLRAETYAENSRIPQMEFGTPEQDAYRRDLTINSLFYNINTREVEDFTGRGIGDLKAGIIRTPLPAESTFLDDPLRVCRSIRFGARFQFELDEELKKAAASEAVRNALRNKVSRERIGHEVELMLGGKAPELAMQHIEDLNLFSTVFRFDPSKKPEPPIPDNYGRLCVDTLRVATRVLEKYGGAIHLNKPQRQICLLGALFLPLRSCTCLEGKKRIPVSTHIISKSLMLKNKDAGGVETILSGAKDFREVTEKLLQAESEASKEVKESVQRESPETAALLEHRVELGLALRKSKELWRCTLLLSSILELPSVTSQGGAAMLALSFDNEMWIEEKAKLCSFVEKAVNKLELEKIWEEKPVLGGNEIKDTLNLAPGKQVQEWKDKVLLWQLAHPSGTAEECLEWLREENVKRVKV